VLLEISVAFVQLTSLSPIYISFLTCFFLYHLAKTTEVIMDDYGAGDLGDVEELLDDDLDDGIEMEKAPDGGLRAWLIVLACFGINLIVQVMASLIDMGLQDTEVSKTLNISTTDALKASNYYKSLSDLYGMCLINRNIISYKL
jgi:hypothetical protein